MMQVVSSFLRGLGWTFGRIAATALHRMLFGR
jgi:hypothetical protein